MSLTDEIAKLEARAAEAEAQRTNGLRWHAGLTDIAGVLARLGIGPTSDKPAAVACDRSHVRPGEDSELDVAKLRTLLVRSTPNDLALCDGLNAVQWKEMYDAEHNSFLMVCEESTEVTGELRAELQRLAKTAEEHAGVVAAKDARILQLIREGEACGDGTDNLHEGRDARAWATDYHEAVGLLRGLVGKAHKIHVEPSDLAMWTIEAQHAEATVESRTEDLESYVEGVADLMKRLGIACDGDPEDKCIACEEEIKTFLKRVETAEARRAAESLEEAIDRAEEWTAQDVREELARDPMWLAKRLGPNERLRAGLDAYAASQKASPAPQTEPPIPDPPGDLDDDPPPIQSKDGPPDVAHRYARNVIGMPEEEIAKAWAFARGAPDQEASFRDVCSRYDGKTAEPVPALAAASKRTEEVETTIPTDWSPAKSQTEYGKTLGFTAEQVRNLAAAFVAESIKSGAKAARWGSRFRSYLTDVASKRDPK